MKKILSILALLLSLPFISNAAISAGWNATSTDRGFIQPTVINGNIPFVQAPYFVASSTTATSTLPLIHTNSIDVPLVNTLNNGLIMTVTGNEPIFGQGIYSFLNQYETLTNGDTARPSNLYMGRCAGTNNCSMTGVGVGATAFDNLNNTAFGQYALSALTTAHDDTVIGTSGGSITTGSNNTLVGSLSGNSLTTAANNTFVGYLSGSTSSGGNNTFIGTQAGANGFPVSGNVMLGYQAGYNEAGSNKLYISNSSTATPLIKGDFAAASTTIYGTLNIATSTATSTSLTGWNISSGCYAINSVCVGGGSSGSAYPFTPTSNYGVNNQATTGIAWFQNGVNASSTSNFVYASTTVISSTGNAYFNGTVGIGTSTPSQKLDVYGNINIPTTTPTVGAIYQNGTRFIHSYGNSNTFVGVGAGNLTFNASSISFNSSNVGVGTGALSSLAGTSGQQGSFNFGLGNNAGSGITTGASNILIGNSVGTGVTTQSYNTIIGDAAGYSSTGLTGVVYIGRGAGRAINTFTDSVFLGTVAGGTTDGGLQTVSSLTNVVAIGARSYVGASNSMVLGSTGTYGLNVGIGTTSPYARLSVHAGATDTYKPTLFSIASSTSAYATTTLFTVLAGGNVGIGTTTPQVSLAVEGLIQTNEYTVATLPTCTALIRGSRAHVTDALAPTFLTALTGGGAVVSPAFCDGTNWVAE